MRNFLCFLFVFSFVYYSAQNEEAVYLQTEHDRLSRVNNHEVAIQNYIDQNIATYNLSPTILNKISAMQDEDGNPLAGNELDMAILYAKKQSLRNLYFSQNPSITADYKATDIPLATPCVNNGFENGDVSGFSFFSHDYDAKSGPDKWEIYKNFPNEPPPDGYPYTPQNESGIISVISNLVPNGGFDNIVSTLSRVKSGNYSIRLNNSTPNYGVSMMTRQINVNKPDLTFNYALVLEDPKHGDNENPYYQCRLKNSAEDIVFERKIVANRNNTAIFKTVNDGNIVYTDWICENIDVSQYMGQVLTLEVIVADCGLGGHFGYAYFDDFCGTKCSAPTFGKIVLDPINITCPFLPLTVMGSFITPPGMELDGLELNIQDNSLPTPNIHKTIAEYTPTGYNTFSFKVKNSDFFPNGVVSNKGFDFFAVGTFKLIANPSSTTEIISQSANVGNDVTFNTTCSICDDCNSQPND
ncbi:MAG: hypothetical protein LBE36_08425 [Flavobacteriaceae bacterium]|jgi:hypothetical protein|nr:hypothetical protein [Flavobacteriaceae bacterium]